MADNTSFQLKNLYSPAFLESFGEAFALVYPGFDSKGFYHAVLDEGWLNRELKQRIRHISHNLCNFLPSEYGTALAYVVQVAQNQVAKEGEQLNFIWMILPDFVEAFGTADPEISIPALGEITRYASAEYAVRPFLKQYPERMYAQMLAWANNESPMVRRLSTEGFRPRLPWGAGVPSLKKDPSPILPVLELLKQDPAETVRRSVANNLNDISKDHPELVLQIARRWQGLGPETDWIIKHACRGLLKKGHAEALALHGFEAGQEYAKIAELRCDDTVKIGDRFNFSFSLVNEGGQALPVRLEYAIDYQTQSGKISRKIFKVQELTLPSGTTVDYQKNQRFQDFTTRKHFPGKHRLEILINGRVGASVDFEVSNSILLNVK